MTDNMLESLRCLSW